MSNPFLRAYNQAFFGGGLGVGASSQGLLAQIRAQDYQQNAQQAQMGPDWESQMRAQLSSIFARPRQRHYPRECDYCGGPSRPDSAGRCCGCGAPTK